MTTLRDYLLSKGVGASAAVCRDTHGKHYAVERFLFEGDSLKMSAMEVRYEENPAQNVRIPLEEHLDDNFADFKIGLELLMKIIEADKRE
jgi:hypothetical protein